MTLLVIDLLSEPLPERLPRGVAGAMKAAHGAIAEHWQRHILPQHFKPHARHKYKHKRRAKATRIRKSRQGKHIDNVDKGLARDIALSYRPVRAFPRRASVKIPGPSYFKMRRTEAHRAHPVSEILTQTQQENEALERLAGETFEEYLDQHAQRSRRRTRVT